MTGLFNALDYAGDCGGVLLLPLLTHWWSAEAVVATGGTVLALFCVAVLVQLGRSPDPVPAPVPQSGD